MTGRLIVLEGPDGAGKSTLVRALADKLVAQGEQVERFALPGNQPGTLGRLVYELHHETAHHGVDRIHPTSLQILHAAAHIDAIHTSIRPALERGATVLMDRYWWSTIVYGRLAGVDAFTLEHLQQLAEHHWRFAAPTSAYVLLGVPPKEPPDAAAQRLREGYKDFVRSLRTPFAVHVVETDYRTTDHAGQILSDLMRDRRSTLP